MKSWRHILLLGAILTSAGCDSAETKDTGPTKADYEKAASELADPVSVIVALRPYLGEQKNPQYMPANRSDFFEGAVCAANEIRHTANQTRLAAKASESKISKELAEPFVEVTKACIKPQDQQDVDRCIKQLDALEKSLTQAADKSKAAGVAKFPLLTEASETAASKEALSQFLKAMGPGPKEKLLIQKLSDEQVKPADLHLACEDAKAEAGAAIDPFEGKNEDLRKLAAVHQQVLVALCTHLSNADGIMMGIAKCKEKPKEEECKSICAEARTTVERGVPAAAFLPLKEGHVEVCEEVDKYDKK